MQQAQKDNEVKHCKLQTDLNSRLTSLNNNLASTQAERSSLQAQVGQLNNMIAGGRQRITELEARVSNAERRARDCSQQWWWWFYRVIHNRACILHARCNYAPNSGHVPVDMAPKNSARPSCLDMPTMPGNTGSQTPGCSRHCASEAPNHSPEAIHLSAFLRTIRGTSPQGNGTKCSRVTREMHSLHVVNVLLQAENCASPGMKALTSISSAIPAVTVESAGSKSQALAKLFIEHA